MKLNRKGNYIHVGTYDFGDEVVALLARTDDSGGAVYLGVAGQQPCHPATLNLPFIVVGLDHPYWSRVLEVLLHETFERAFTILNARFRESDGYSRSMAAYQFMMNHEVFTEACSRVAGFLSLAQPDLARIYKQTKHERNK